MNESQQILTARETTIQISLKLLESAKTSRLVLETNAKKLMPFHRKCLSEQKNSYIKYDKLVIDDDVYAYDSSKKVPDLIAQYEGGRRSGTINSDTKQDSFYFLTNCLLNIGVWNISGLQNKLDGINSEIDAGSFNNFIQTFDVLCFIETWAHMLSQFTNAMVRYDVRI